MYRHAIRRKCRPRSTATPHGPAPARRSWSPVASLAHVPAHAPPMIGAANDRAERQADTAADRVMRRTAAPSHEPVAGGVSAAATPAGPVVRSALAALGGGAPLAAAERAFFEPRFGADLSKVRIHAGPAGAAASQALGARAFTLGTDIGFAAGEYRPGTSEGRHLLAHEIAHVRQGEAAPVVRRKPCKDAVPACDAEKQKKAEAKVAGNTTYKSFVYGATTADCYRPLAMAERLKQANAKLYTGNATRYTDDVVVPLNGIDTAKIHTGDCFAFPQGWQDPNIGDIDAELAALRAKGNEAAKNRIIAAVYAEMSHAVADVPDADQQRAYILYSMLLRIGSDAFPATLAKVATSKTYHAIGTSTNYQPALDYLNGGKPAAALNKDAVDKVKALVDSVSAASIPANAGPYYFHWRESGGARTTTAVNEYAKQLKAGKPADEAEKRAAYKQAKDVVGATMDGVTPEKGWLKKIPGANKGKADERIGSMYIYK